MMCLLWICILSSVVTQLVFGDQGSDFLDNKETQVQRIAEGSIANYAKKCELVDSCSDADACSRGGCSPRLEDLHQLQCTSVNNNPNCPVENCQSMRVNFNRSYVRYPESVSWDNFGNVPEVSPEVRDAICSQRKLDPIFLELFEEQRQKNYTADDLYFNFYFGSSDGTMRFYPGLEVKSCGGYDPRVRPWYNGAISVQKDIVVLLDNGASMYDEAGLTVTQTTMKFALNLTQGLLSTLTPDDTAHVISFPASKVKEPLDQSYRAGNNTANSDFKDLIEYVQEEKEEREKSNVGGPSNYTAALLRAISYLSTRETDEHLKIVILFTNDKSPAPSEDQLSTILTDFTDEPIKLFIYEITDDQGTPSLNTTACFLGGYHERISTLDSSRNPLYALSSYFSFLARSHLAVEGGAKAFWQTAYKDFGLLGTIITVAFPAMSPDGLRLIGVAAIDIQTGDFQPLLQTSIETSLKTRKKTIPINTKGVDFNNCTTVERAICESDTNNSGICRRDDHGSSYEDLICCGACGVDDAESDTTIAVVTSLISAFAVAGLGVAVYFKFCRPGKKPPYLRDIVKVPKFSYEVLSTATNKFSESNILGKGTYGTVYVGTLSDGMKVAVKKLSAQLKPGHDLEFNDFEAEITVLAKANHNNLVELKGFCVEPHHILVYEHVENGDLEGWLFRKPQNENKVLPWASRVRIAKGTAKGLVYLHEELQNQQKVCHADIKPANILLDRQFNPKVADFGMAKLYDASTQVYARSGTVGYMAPEVLHLGGSTMADVYSYGMVLLVMVTGRTSGDVKTGNLRKWVIENLVVEGKEREVLDPLLSGIDEADVPMVKKLLDIAIHCTLHDPENRPTMSEVQKMIDGYLPIPDLHQHRDLLSCSSGSGSISMDSGFSWDGSWNLSQGFTKIRSSKG